MGRPALAAALGALLVLLAAAFAAQDAARAEGRIGGEPPRGGVVRRTGRGDRRRRGGGRRLRLALRLDERAGRTRRLRLRRAGGGERRIPRGLRRRRAARGDSDPARLRGAGASRGLVRRRRAPRRRGHRARRLPTTTATAECVWSFGYWLPDGGAASSMAIALIDPEHRTFVSRSCGVWEKDPAPLIEPGQPFGDGAWLVGSEVAPGRYRATAPTDGCRWERLGRRAYGWPGAGGAPSARTAVLINAGDAAFFSRGCGVGRATRRRRSSRSSRSATACGSPAPRSRPGSTARRPPRPSASGIWTTRSRAWTPRAAPRPRWPSRWSWTRKAESSPAAVAANGRKTRRR